MSEHEVAPSRTPILAGDLYLVLRRAWRTLLRSEPSRASLLVLLAQWHYETGGGGASICWNLAGIKYTPGCGHNWASYTTQENVGGQWRTIHPPDPGCRFRAYDSLDDAAADYLALLTKRFAAAWPAVVAGDVKAFAQALSDEHYYTAPVAQYTAGLEARLAVVEREVGGDTQPATPISIARVQPEPGDDEDGAQPTPPGDLPEPPDEPA